MIVDGLAFFGVVVLVAITLYKMMNVINEAQDYDWKQSLVLCIIGIFAWLFSFASTLFDYSTSLYAFLLNISTFVGSIIVILTVAEIIFYIKAAATEGLSRFGKK